MQDTCHMISPPTPFMSVHHHFVDRVSITSDGICTVMVAAASLRIL